MPVHASGSRPFPDCPLVVAYGLGVDSTAMPAPHAGQKSDGGTPGTPDAAGVVGWTLTRCALFGITDLGPHL